MELHFVETLAPLLEVSTELVTALQQFGIENAAEAATEFDATGFDGESCGTCLKMPSGVMARPASVDSNSSMVSTPSTSPNKGETIHADQVMELEQYPEDKTEKDLEKHVAPAIRGHMKDLLRCIATRGKPVADIEQGCISSVSSILANLSMQLGRSLEWDPLKGQVVNDDEANKLLRRTYRAPWVHPDPAKV